MTDSPSVRELPPEPPQETEKDRIGAALVYARRAVKFAIEGNRPAAIVEFFESWQRLLQSHYDDLTETEHRRTAWDQAERAQGLLAIIADELYGREEPAPDQIYRVRRLLADNGYRHELEGLADAPSLARITTADSLKTVREALCAAQAHLGVAFADNGQGERASRVLGRLITDIDRQRPLGPDGQHGDRHTPTCGCEDRT